MEKSEYEAVIYDENDIFTLTKFTDKNTLIWYVCDLFNNEYGEPTTRLSILDYGEDGDKIIHAYWRSGKRMTAIILCINDIAQKSYPIMRSD